MNHWFEVAALAQRLHDDVRWSNTVSVSMEVEGSGSWGWKIEVYVNDWAFEIERSGAEFEVRMWTPTNALWQKSYGSPDALVVGINDTIDGETL